jgi:glycosyltransferase involved in cell wall biosynthesis
MAGVGGVRTHGEQTARDGTIDRIVVAIPARNEVASIAECIRSVDRAAQTVGLPTCIVVAADSCDDDTAGVARSIVPSQAELVVIEADWGSAGAARSAAVAVGIDEDAALERVWIANTDADTVVPADWLSVQVELARDHHAVAGVVELDPSRTSTRVLDRFGATYRLDGDRHLHVHGANLGVRADAYLAVGRWCPTTIVGEDHGLWRRLVEAGYAVTHRTSVRVTTSSRLRSRVEGGFATVLRTLAVAPTSGS